jgi:hypothetical protein
MVSVGVPISSCQSGRIILIYKQLCSSVRGDGWWEEMVVVVEVVVVVVVVVVHGDGGWKLTSSQVASASRMLCVSFVRPSPTAPKSVTSHNRH